MAREDRAREDVAHDETPPRRRPMGVTVVVILTWLAAVVDVVGGIALFLVSFGRGVIDANAVDVSLVRYFALIAIVVGLLTIMVAWSLGNGGQLARVAIIAVMALRLANALWALFTIGAFLTWGALFDAVLAVAIIALLTTRAASDYFRGRIQDTA